MLSILLLLSVHFLPVGSASAALSYTQTNSLVTKAEKLAGALKWQISVDYNKNLAMPDMALFNQTKDAYNKAQTAVSALKDSRKASLQQRLDTNVKIHITRAIAYIDALNGGKKLETLTNELRYLMKDEIYTLTMDDLYHELSFQIRKQATLLYRVYGKSTREAILAKYKVPAEATKNKLAYFVTVKDLVDKAQHEMAKDEVDIYGMIDYLITANDMLPIIQQLYPDHVAQFLQTDILNLSKELSFISEPEFEGPQFDMLNTSDAFQETMIVYFDMGGYYQEELYYLDEPLQLYETRIINFEFIGYEYTALLHRIDDNPWVAPNFYTLDISEIQE